jgi:3-hydroxyisobutyrate dehydrogenase-like beta-hydroxyacid dehydrogenase
MDDGKMRLVNTIGVIGLGIIGQAWAERYRQAGRLAGVWNRTPRREAPGWRDSPAAVAAADVTHIVVADPPAVAEMLAQITPVLGPGKAVVQSSTIDPESAARCEAQVRATGALYVESPFTGSKPAALAGTVVFFMGGAAAALDAVEPVLALLSETRFRLPTVRQAAALKLAMNLNIAIQMEALSESLTFARRAGIDDDFYFEVLAKNVSHSGLAPLKKDKLRARDFSPQFSVKHMHKDMRLADELGARDLPLLKAVRARLAAAEAAGFGDDDFSSLVRLLGG